uniref:Small hydrophilic protein n=1 Tax=Heterorhabditis bacteriophora TaxID=37862 RepID=A0A1I7XM55_HETBA
MEHWTDERKEHGSSGRGRPLFQETREQQAATESHCQSEAHTYQQEKKEKNKTR